MPILARGDTLILSVASLNVSYGRVQVLYGVSVQVADSQIVALLGANGAGKSTLLAAISGLLRPSAGSIAIAGENITGLKPEKIVRRGLSLVPERRDLFPDMTVEENLRMGAYLRRDRSEVLRDLDTVIEYFPVLGNRLSQPALTLSGGEQQMLAIARALMARPRLLLLDEPSLGVSPVMTETILEIIERVNQERRTAIFLVEQNTRVALSIAQQGYVMETGRIIAHGASKELLNSDLIRRSYLGEGD